MERDRDYFERRLIEEDWLASTAQCPCSRASHRQLAALYRAQLWDLGSGIQTPAHAQVSVHGVHWYLGVTRSRHRVEGDGNHRRLIFRRERPRAQRSGAFLSVRTSASDTKPIVRVVPDILGGFRPFSFERFLDELQ